MTNMFDTMLNHTAPTAHLGQRRGVLTGGSVNARNRIMNESLWHFVPPSFDAGCGGIDLFAGSFSFISAEQFQNLLRAIAANATFENLDEASLAPPEWTLATADEMRRRAAEFRAELPARALERRAKVGFALNRNQRGHVLRDLTDVPRPSSFQSADVVVVAVDLPFPNLEGPQEERLGGNVLTLSV